MITPAAPQVFPGQPAPDSAARRRFRALARSAPWLSSSLHLELQVPQPLGDATRQLEGILKLIIRKREALAIRNASGALVYQAERFTSDRGRDYVAATSSSWQVPPVLTSPVYTKDHLVLRRPDIAGFDGLLPLDYWEALLDPVELAGSEPAALDLAFDHPTFIHELAETSFADRPVLAAVLSAGYSYRPSVAGFALVPPEARVLIMLDLGTGICVHRRVLSDEAQGPGEPNTESSVRVLAQDEYYIDSLFTTPAPTLTDVRSPMPWELRDERQSG